MRKIFGIGETILDIIFQNNQPYKAVPGGSVFNGLITLGRMGLPVTFMGKALYRSLSWTKTRMRTTSFTKIIRRNG